MKPSEDVKKMFEQDRFATDNGAYIEEVDDHYAKCSLMIEDRHKNAMGAVMGDISESHTVDAGPPKSN